MSQILTDEKCYLLALSDLHKGSALSGFTEGSKPEQVFNKALERSRHIVFVGDIYELLMLTKDKGKKKKSRDAEHSERIIQNAVDNAINELNALLEKYPEKQFHFVLGNHEGLKKFTKALDHLQEMHKNFEWHPEAIKVGDTLFTHGDLQMDQKTIHERKMHNVESAGRRMRLAPAYNWLLTPDSTQEAVTRRLVRHRIKSEVSASLVAAQLAKRAQKGSEYEALDEDVEKRKREKLLEKVMHYKENGEEKLWTIEEYSTTKHIMFGHTHIPFTHFPVGHLHLHNMGSAMSNFARNDGNMDYIVAELADNGSLQNIVAHHEYVATEEAANRKWRTVAEGYAPQVADANMGRV